jgi:hypothetical protein
MTDGQSEQLAAQALTGHLTPADRDPMLRRQRGLRTIADRLMVDADGLESFGLIREALVLDHMASALRRSAGEE